MDESENECFVQRLRAQNSEQFYNLVRMHLSFVLDLNTEESDNADKKARPTKWNLPFLLKKPKPVKSTDGCHLSEDLIRQMEKLIDHLNIPENLKVEGIFRRSGKLKRQQELKMKLVMGENVDLSTGNFSVHDCASVLKTYLSELPEPLLTEVHYPAYCQVADLTSNENRLLEAIQLLVLLLPPENYNLLRKILRLLNLAAQYEKENRMSPQNLATLFTPHLICSKKLSPETLHQQSQLMAKVVAFMIEKADAAFCIPVKLATDARAYWTKKEQSKCPSSVNQMNESGCDGATVTTVFSFVDIQRTAKENGASPTTIALAKLYAHVYSMPDGDVKNRFVKRAKESAGPLTPQQPIQHKRSRSRSRVIRDSLKKRLFKSGRESPKKTPKNSSDEERGRSKLKTPLMPIDHKKLHRPFSSTNESSTSRQPLRATENRKARNDSVSSVSSLSLCSSSSPSSSSSSSSNSTNCADQKLTQIAHKSLKKTHGIKRTSSIENASVLKLPCLAPPPPVFDTPVRTPISRGGLRMAASVTGLTTSTPAAGTGMTTAAGSIFATPIGLQRTNSMSPITRSAQRMSRAMQETMMTPRSRKPVVSLSGSDLCHLAAEVDEQQQWMGSTLDTRRILEESEGNKEPFGNSVDECNLSQQSLSTTFREYLYSRSNVNNSLLDLSFSSRTDDFQSDKSSRSGIEDENVPKVDDILMDEDNFSNSLLYCLNGNDPTDLENRYDSLSEVCETAI